MNIQQLNYKNISAYNTSVKEVVEDLSWNDRYMLLNFELKNKALNEYERVMRKYPNIVSKDFLTLEYSAVGNAVEKDSIDKKLGFEGYEDYKLDYTEGIFINGRMLDVEDKNLWIFEKLYKTLMDISKMKPSDFILNLDFLNSLDSYNLMKHAVMVEQPTYVDKFIKESHNPESVKKLFEKFAGIIDNLVVKTLF